MAKANSNQISHLENPVTTAVQLVRAGTFFIPVRFGANEIGLVLIVETLVGLPSLGLAAALIRRGRELLWII